MEGLILSEICRREIMTHAQSLYHAPSGHRTSVSRLFAEWRGAIKEWRRRARSRRELAALCDRCLRDMRVTRYDADREVRKPFWRA
jgi:uncharacterized protein YjiS (DUF1127 family)